uniref:Uncharacterized protein n=1 Tax=Caenorhabditis japonica TaxID=281687 RepID=A0A8R1HPR7_CAEJA
MVCLIHASIFIERLYASLRLGHYENSEASKPTLSVFLLIFSCASALTIVYFMLIADDKDEKITHCLSFSATKMGNSFYTLFCCQFYFEIGLFMSQFLLRNYNRLQQQDITKTLGCKYQLFENLQVLEQITPIIITCSLVIGTYNLTALLLRLFKDVISKNLYILLTFYIWVMPHLPYLMSFLSFRIIRENIRSKTERLKDAVTSSEEAVFSFSMYKWDEAYDRRFNVTVGKIRWWNKICRLINL